jgi:hypothetical protein
LTLVAGCGLWLGYVAISILVASGDARHGTPALGLGFLLTGGALVMVGVASVAVVLRADRRDPGYNVHWFKFLLAAASGVALVFMNGYASIAATSDEALNAAAGNLIVAVIALVTALTAGFYVVVFDTVGPKNQPMSTARIKRNGPSSR